MPEIPYLVDSNILIRWVQPHDPDYPGIETALTVLTGWVACSATPLKTSLSSGTR